MKKIFLTIALAIFSVGFSQETPKKACCAGKDKKECATKDKKECSDKEKKECSGKDKKECKTDANAKKSCCASKKATV
jgi:hypothetical protein